MQKESVNKTPLKKAKKKRYVSFNTVFTASVFVVLLLFCVSLILPVLWMVWTSFKDVYEFYLYPFDLPQMWFPQNYAETLEKLQVTRIRNGAYYTYGVAEMTGYSLLIAATKPLPGIFWSLVSGYILSKYDFKGKKVFMAINLFVMTVPFIGTLPASMRLAKAIGKYDNLLLQVLLSGTPFGFGFLLYYGALKGISKSYSEAAFMDGASQFTVMWRIVIPMVIPTAVAQYLLAFIGQWNDYMDVVTWLPSYPNLAFGMFLFQNEAARYGVGMPHILAGFVIVAIPTSIMWICGQKVITSKLMVGGLKE